MPPADTTGPIRTAPAETPADEAGTSASAPRPQPAAPSPEPVVLPLPPTPRPQSDEFAGLPRLKPFTDFELDPVEAADAAYTGRRRRADEEAPSAGGPADGEETGRRHRRAEDSNDDLLARLLAREGR
jgi:hypothetical protein